MHYLFPLILDNSEVSNRTKKQKTRSVQDIFGSLVSIFDNVKLSLYGVYIYIYITVRVHIHPQTLFFLLPKADDCLRR